MKQKIVIKVFSLTGKKSQSRALKIVVSVQGVESVKSQIDKSQIEVVGDGVDAVKLTNMLRKKMEKRKIGRFCRRSLVHAELVSVSSMDGKKDQEEKDQKNKGEKKQEPKIHPYPYGGGVPQFYVHELRPYDDHYPCSIM